VLERGHLLDGDALLRDRVDGRHDDPVSALAEELQGVIAGADLQENTFSKSYL
jgi:hypothetical protein